MVGCGEVSSDIAVHGIDGTTGGVRGDGVLWQQ